MKIKIRAMFFVFLCSATMQIICIKNHVSGMQFWKELEEKDLEHQIYIVQLIKNMGAYQIFKKTGLWIPSLSVVQAIIEGGLKNGSVDMFFDKYQMLRLVLDLNYFEEEAEQGYYSD